MGAVRKSVVVMVVALSALLSTVEGFVPGLPAVTRGGVTARSVVRPLHASSKKMPNVQVETFDPMVIDGSLKQQPAGLGLNLEPVEGKEEMDTTLYKGMLLLVAVIWGSNFGALKYLDTCGVDVSILTTIRFFLASLSLAPFLWKQSPGLIKAGMEVGLWVTLGYITQALGLQTTDASKSAFICSLTVVVVPLINGLMGRKIQPTTWAACLLALLGVGLLTLQGAAGITSGDLWSMGQPIGFGIAFMRIEHYMGIYKGKALPLAAGQMLSVFLCSLAWMGFKTDLFQHIPDLSVLADPIHGATLAYTGVVTSALAVVLESIALAFVPAEETAVIFSTEPLWAAATSALVLGERLKPVGMLGGFAILSACLLTQLDMSSLAEWLPLAEESTNKVEQ